MPDAFASQPSLQLYVILDHDALGRLSVDEATSAALAGGARLFQYRDKTASMREAYLRATRIRDLTGNGRALLVINDRADLALAVEADGVHLGQDDLPVKHARRLLGRGKVIGLSTHTARQVQDGTMDGPDYVAFGPIFQTHSKRTPEPAVGLDGLRSVRGLSRVPLFAIGGITLQTLRAVMEAGASGVAVISAIWSAADPAEAVAAFLAGVTAARRPPSR